MAWLPPLVPFQCNVCGHLTVARGKRFTREGGHCLSCKSTVRFRSIVAALSERLFDSALPLPKFPRGVKWNGLGLSDAEGYARPLKARLDYTNTYYHQEPRLDIANVPDSACGTAGFLISSDVFEHVPPPAAAPFEGSFRLLRSGGVLVFTVPYAPSGETREHYPELYDFKIVGEGNRRVLQNRTRQGREERFENLCFHGGDGSTLEMRLYSLPSLLQTLERAGFVDIKVHDRPHPRFGIWHKNRASLPISARKP